MPAACLYGLRHQRFGHPRCQLIERHDLVERGVGHDARNERRVHGVTRALGDDMAQKRTAEQREVADQVERFVAAAFVRVNACPRG